MQSLSNFSIQLQSLVNASNNKFDFRKCGKCIVNFADLFFVE